MKAAVFMHLGNEKSDSESDDQDSKRFWESDDSDGVDSNDDSEVDKDDYNAFSFCQIICEDGRDEWEIDSLPGSVNGEDFMKEVEDIVDDSLNETSETAKLEQVLSVVIVEQNKPSTWVNAVTYKFGTIDIFTVTELRELFPYLNQRIKIDNFPTFHRTTLAGISAETSKSLEADFRRGQA